MDDLGDVVIGEIADRLFETVHDDARWADVMHVVKSALGLSSGAFGYVDAATGAQMILHGDCAEEYALTFMVDEVENPLAPAVLRGEVGAVHIDQMAMSRQDFERSTFYNEWLRPQGEHSALTVTLLRNGDVGAHLSVLRERGRRPFDESDIAKLAQLIPVLERVTRLRIEFGGRHLADRLGDHNGTDDGFFVVDAKGRILLQNHAAEEYLRDPDSGLIASNGVLRVEGRMRDRFRRAVEQAATIDLVLAMHCDMLLEDPMTGERRSAVSVVPMPEAPILGLPVGRAAGVLVRRLGARLPAGFAERVRGLFVLTAREVELAGALATGGSVQDFARIHSISLATARTHLSRLLQKTDTTRQGELIALLHSMTN